MSDPANGQHTWGFCCLYLAACRFSFFLRLLEQTRSISIELNESHPVVSDYSTMLSSSWSLPTVCTLPEHGGVELR
jgi:hypothetical protein